MILSFSLTIALARQHGVSDPLRTGVKTVSRRDWTDKQAQRWISAYRRDEIVHKAYSALPFVQGAYHLGDFTLSCEPYPERLADMPETDLQREGGFWLTKQDFIDDVGKGDPDKILWVVRWSSFTLA
ncbi:MAG: hypothetical protein HC862_02775 [Scytonema sp. RU_4_4]|nr:hypothetical protein [Scytonema sp. RU_4_4]